MIKLIGKYQDPDSTRKFVFKTNQGTIEITQINTKKDRDIFCVPSLYGCTLGCTFCFLTTLNISQTNKKISYKTIKSCLDLIPHRTNRRQISIMGVGDASLNLEMIYEACEQEEVVSIASIFPKKIPKMPSNLKIHYSLHSPLADKRKKIMPSAKMPIEEVFSYLNKHDGKSEVHYTLIANENDSDEELSALINLMKKNPINIKFLDFKESGSLQKSLKLSIWMEKLKEYTSVEFYNPPGEKIQGSCGQFSKGFYETDYKKTESFKNFEKEYSF